MSASEHELSWGDVDMELLSRPVGEALAELLRASEALDPDTTSAAEFLDAL